MNVGIIGCGNIAPVYFNSHKFYNNFKVTACADIVHEVAKKSAGRIWAARCRISGWVLSIGL